MRRLLFSLAVLALALPGASLPPAPAEARAAVQAAAPDRARERLNARVFDRVWNDVRRHYYDPTLNGLDWDAARETWRPQALAATDERELYMVLGRMLSGLEDRHATAAPPASVVNQELQRRRRPVMGLTMDAGLDGHTIRDIRPGSPADEARLELGWRLVSVDGAPFEPDRVLEDGVPVVLGLRHPDGRYEERTLVPRLMDPVEPWRAGWARHDVLVLTLEQFDEGLGAWVGAMLAAAPEGTRVVLDLRGNGGGRIVEAQNVLSCFLPAGRQWAVRTSRANSSAPMAVEPGCPPYQAPLQVPLAVLVDRYSRSAAELTPAALQEAGRAVIVGEPTPGSVLISSITDLPDGGRLTLSRANIVTAGGVRLEGTGVTPDILAPTTLEDRRAGRDPTLEAAIAALDGQD